MASSSTFDIAFFNRLSVELKDEVFGYVDDSSLSAFGCTCKPAYGLVSSYLGARLFPTVKKILILMEREDLIPQFDRTPVENSSTAFHCVFTPYRIAIQQLNHLGIFAPVNGDELFKKVHIMLEQFVVAGRSCVAEEVARFYNDANPRSSMCTLTAWLLVCSGDLRNSTRLVLEEKENTHATKIMTLRQISLRHVKAGDLLKAEHVALKIGREDQQGMSLEKVGKAYISDGNIEEACRVANLIAFASSRTCLVREIFPSCQDIEQVKLTEGCVGNSENLFCDLFNAYLRIGSMEDAERVLLTLLKGSTTKAIYLAKRYVALGDEEGARRVSRLSQNERVVERLIKRHETRSGLDFT